VISSEAYADRYAVGLTDAVRDVPGVYAEKKFGEDAGCRSAARASAIPATTAGPCWPRTACPLNDADGYGDFQLIDPSLARYTEVYKGGNALRFGGALLGGAINLVTPTGRTAGPTILRVDGGSFGTVRAHVEVARTYGD
jgi:iron complex outermembrane receptor protein